MTPSKIIACQLKFDELKNLPKSADLKYLLSVDRPLDDEKLLTVLIDVALIKRLPNIKIPLLRLLYNRAEVTLKREFLLKPIKLHHSPLSALLTSFFELNDFVVVFDILKKYPEVILPETFLLNENFIKTAKASDKLELIYEIYSRIPFVTLQNKFDFVCKCLALTFDNRILDLFLAEAYKPTELWNENYTETYFNAWIHAMTSETGNYAAVLERDTKNMVININNSRDSVHLAVRKQTLLLLFAIRENHQNRRLLLEDFIEKFDSSTFKSFYEEILWILVVEEQFSDFFFLSNGRFDHFDSSQLRLAIAKSKSTKFITDLFDNFNVNKLFSNNLYGDAVYNKRLFFALTHYKNEEVYLQSCLLDANLFKYAVIHFKLLTEWERLFEIRNDWSTVSFSQLFEYLLKNYRNLLVFEKIVELLKNGVLRIAAWGRPRLHINIEEAEFLLKNINLRFLLTYLSPFMEFHCEPTVMAHLIVTNTCEDGKLLKLLKFNVNDVLIQLPHWKDHDRYTRLFNLTHKSYLIQLKRAMRDLKLANSVVPDQDTFDQSLMTIFNPILSKLKWEFPVDYLLVLPFHILMQTVKRDPVYMKKAVEYAAASNRLDDLFNAVRGNTFKVKGPIDIQYLPILNSHRIRIIIV